MLELLAYAYLLRSGLKVENIYEEKLNQLFLADPENEDLLELEFLSGNIKETIQYIWTHVDYASLDHDRFGRTLMDLLKPAYKSMDLRKFGDMMYSLWESLPGNLQHEEPFFTLCYADDPLMGKRKTDKGIV